MLKKETGTTEPSIIELILSSRTESPVPKVVEHVTILSFFGNAEEEGFSTESQFSETLRKSNRNDLRALEYTLKMMKNNEEFFISPFERVDPNGNDYAWVEPKKENSKGFKVYTFGNFFSLLEAYSDHLLTCDITLDELYNATKAK